ncbi:MAG: hypothetical protein ACXAC8_18100 [Candidatus Hodarchaeales archaeon]
MAKKQNLSQISLGFDFKECWQLLKNTGIPRVSNESVTALNRLLTRRGRELATKAVTLASEKDRDEVRGVDITQAVTLTSNIAAYEVGDEAPVVYYVWFISSGGTCLLSRSYSGLEFPDTIFSGLLTGILDLLTEVTGRTIEKFSTDDLTIHIRRIAEITVAVICDSEKSDQIDELTDLLAHRFSDVFSQEIEQDVIDTSIFDDFTAVLDALVAGAGFLIPKERLKVIRKSTSLTDKQLEETVEKTALREEMRRAHERIQDLDLFKKGDEFEGGESSKVDSLLHEPPDVTEIKAVLRQASQNIRDEFNGVDNSEKEGENVMGVSREEVLKEISRDFPEIIPGKVPTDRKPDPKIESVLVNNEIIEIPIIAPKRTSKPAPKRTSKPAPKRVSKPAPKRTSKSAPKRVSKPAPKRVSKKAPKRASKPAPKRASKKASGKPQKSTTKKSAPRRKKRK